MDTGGPEKLHVILVHGTWSDGGLWTEVGTTFRGRLDDMLHEVGYEYDLNSEPEIVLWHSRNKAKSRTVAARRVTEATERARSNVLVIGHSHGGNVAVDAVRDVLREHPEKQVLGVVCMNTPFLAQEIRSAGSYLKFWIAAAVFFFVSLFILPPTPHAGSTGLGWLEDISLAWTAWLFGGVSMVLFAMWLLGKSMKRAAAASEYLGPRVRVLCLSCPDDEAISLLGLAEGVANAVQIFLHPLALMLCLLAGLGWAAWGMWCGGSPLPGSEPFERIRAFFLAWTWFAIVLSAFGSLVVGYLFGLNLSGIIRATVSRVLVSYVPLRPASTIFRPICELDVPWWNPFGIVHSSIYNAEETMTEIRKWLQEATRSR